MGMFDSKKKTTNITEVNNVSTVNQQEGLLNLAQGTSLTGNVNISNGSAESVEAMKDVSKDAFNFGENAIEMGLESLATNSKLSEFAIFNSLDFGRDALAQNAKLSGDSYDFVQSVMNQSSANSAAANSSIKELAKTVVTNGESDIQDLSEKKIYVIGAVIVAVILGLVLIAMMGRR